MCYWELKKLTKKDVKKWTAQATANRDGFGMFCLTCWTYAKTMIWKELQVVLRQHYKHVVAVHFRLCSTGTADLGNVQPIIWGDNIIMHNGDFQTYAQTEDWRSLMPNGFSDTWVLAQELSKAWDGEEVDEEKPYAVLERMKEISKYDFIANYLFLNKKFMVVSLGGGNFNSSKHPLQLNTGGWDVIQAVYQTEHVKKLLDVADFMTFDDYARDYYHGSMYANNYAPLSTLDAHGTEYRGRYYDDDYWEKEDDTKLIRKKVEGVEIGETAGLTALSNTEEEDCDTGEPNAELEEVLNSQLSDDYNLNEFLITELRSELSGSDYFDIDNINDTISNLLFECSGWTKELFRGYIPLAGRGIYFFEKERME